MSALMEPRFSLRWGFLFSGLVLLLFPLLSLVSLEVLCVALLLRAMLRCAAVGAVPVRAVGPFRRVRGQALLSLAPPVMPRCSSAFVGLHLRCLIA